jgi:uncharacterized protein YbaR (Trm112 family)
MPAKRSSASGWYGAAGWRSGGSGGVIRFQPVARIWYPSVTHGGAAIRTALNGPDLCYIGAEYLPVPDMDKHLLDIIYCPVTKLPLEILDAERLGRLNAAIEAGNVKNYAAIQSSEQIEEALVTRDGRLVYPIRNGIPVLMEEESIDWNQLAE